MWPDSSDTSEMRWILSLFMVLGLAGCGALSQDNVLPTNGPIPNPAIDAGVTQAQGALSSTGEGNGNLDQQPLRIAVDDDLIEVSNVSQLADVVDDARGSLELEHCVVLLAAPPTSGMGQCSYNPDGQPVIIDTFVIDECGDGRELLTLNRPSGEGAFVGVVGGRWFEFDAQAYSVAAVEQVCAS